MAKWEQLVQDLTGHLHVNANFGDSVALSADGAIFAVGIQNNRDVASRSGSVGIFWYNDADEEWQQIGQSLDGDAANDELGVSVALSSDGRIVAAGARRAIGSSSAGSRPLRL